MVEGWRRYGPDHRVWRNDFASVTHRSKLLLYVVRFLGSTVSSLLENRGRDKAQQISCPVRWISAQVCVCLQTTMTWLVQRWVTWPEVHRWTAWRGGIRTRTLAGFRRHRPAWHLTVCERTRLFNENVSGVRCCFSDTQWKHWTHTCCIPQALVSPRMMK